MFQQTIKNFGINFNALNERNAVSAGDLLTGHLSFELTKETKVSAITMQLTGRAHVHWSTGGGGGRKRRSNRRHFSAKLEFFNFKSVIVQDSDCGVSGNFKLPAGTHVYPFSCQLPPGDFPPAFQGVHGRILYTVTVGISRPWHMSKDFETELNFVHYINPSEPELWAPLSGTNMMNVCCMCWASGPITMTASLEKKAFMPGETVKITCKVNNISPRTVTVKARLQQKQMFLTLNHSHKTMMSKKLAALSGRPIDGNTSNVDVELMMTISATAAPTISNCSILVVEYMLEVYLDVRGSSNLSVLFPIILYHATAQRPPLLCL